MIAFFHTKLLSGALAEQGRAGLRIPFREIVCYSNGQREEQVVVPALLPSKDKRCQHPSPPGSHITAPIWGRGHCDRAVQPCTLLVTHFAFMDDPFTATPAHSMDRDLWRISVLILTDALVHVCIAKAEVSQWTGWEADPNLPDIVPLQKDEELGGTSQAPVELRAQVAAPGTALAQLSANCKSRREAVVRRASLLCKSLFGGQPAASWRQIPF